MTRIHVVNTSAASDQNQLLDPALKLKSLPPLIWPWIPGLQTRMKIASWVDKDRLVQS